LIIEFIGAPGVGKTTYVKKLVGNLKNEYKVIGDINPEKKSEKVNLKRFFFKTWKLKYIKMYLFLLKFVEEDFFLERSKFESFKDLWRIYIYIEVYKFYSKKKATIISDQGIFQEIVGYFGSNSTIVIRKIHEDFEFCMYLVYLEKSIDICVKNIKNRNRKQVPMDFYDDFKLKNFLSNYISDIEILLKSSVKINENIIVMGEKEFNELLCSNRHI